jgi:hypothetical protein
VQADDRDVFAKKIKISTGRGTIYQLLQEVSAQSGYAFIYDSRIMDNDKRVSVRRGEYTLKDAIYIITGNKQLKIDVLGNHILLRLEEEDRIRFEEKTTDTKKIILRGTVYEFELNEPIPYVNVGITGTTIGTVTNRLGEFQLIIADTISRSNLRISHLGYESQEIESRLLAGQHVNFYLKPGSITLEEITVNIADPKQVLNDMLKQKEKNYSFEPALLTCFYREGIEHKRRIIDLTEAVLQVYKTGSQFDSSYDQVKLIKKRRITNQLQTDTIFPRMKSGINSCLILDIIKEMPDFMYAQNNEYYSYSYQNVTTIDDRLANIITFRQKPSVSEPLYTGDLYIETESKALVEIQIEMNPKHITKATHLFVARKTHDLNLTLQEAKYIVSYKLSANGMYYINHIRGDIVFNVRKRNHLFSSPLHFWFEMVTCKIDTENIRSFPRNERLSQTQIFAETKHPYDQDFWENFNFILPEERLKEAMINNLNEVIVNAE